MNRNIQRTALSLIAGLLLFGLACGPISMLATPTAPALQPEATPPAEPTAEPAAATPRPKATRAPTKPSATATPVEVAAATPTLESGGAGLQPDLPWLIVSTSDGLWAANMDGSNLTQLTQKSYLDINLSRAVSSPARQIAVLTSGQDDYHGLALQTISLPDGKVQKLTDLTTPDTEPGPDAAPGDAVLEAMRAIAEHPAYDWSPDGKQLAFIAALDGPQAEVYVTDIFTLKTHKVSQGNGQAFWPTWSPNGKSILYFEADNFGTGAGLTMKGIWRAAPDGSGSEQLETSQSGGEQMLGWRDHETAVLLSWDMAQGPSQLRLYNIRTRQQTILQAGPVLGAAVATGAAVDAGAILYASNDGLYLLPPDSDQPQKLDDQPVSAYGAAPIRWKDYERVFVVRFEGGNLATVMADGSHRQDAPFNPSTGATDVSTFALIWGWTEAGGKNEGAWISGPGLETVQVLKGPATAPVWNIDNDLLFFVGPELYRTTFNSHYSDVASVASLTGDVLETAWLGFSEALNKKYGP